MPSVDQSGKGFTTAGGPLSPISVLATESSSVADNAQLALNVVIFLLAAALALVVLGLPRALARFSRCAEWRNGHFLYSLSAARRNATMQTSRRHIRPTTFDRRTGSGTNERTDQSSLFTFSDQTSGVLSVRRGGSACRPSPFPPHVREWTTVMYPLARVLRYRIDMGFSLSQLLVLGLYTGVALFATFLRSNPFVDPLRTGFVAMAMIPFVYAYATKNNVFAALLGIGYEKLNFLHRYTGLLLTLASDVHFVGYIYAWTADGTFVAHIRRPNIAWGLAAVVVLNFLTLTSTAYWRQKFHSAFYLAHIVGFTAFLPTVCFHGPVLIPYVLAAAGAYVLDLLFRTLKTRLCTARLTALPALSMTGVQVPSINAGWRAGQHVRLRMLSSAGWPWMWTAAHPFTIASVCGGDEGLVLMCKRAGGWTDGLYELAKRAGYAEKESGVREVKVLIEGPYGGPGHTVFASYSAAVFVVGGSGITFALSAVQELVQKDIEGKSRLKVIELIWSVQDPASLPPLIPLLKYLLEQSPSPLRISVFYTRANAPSSALPPREQLPKGLTLTTGRAKIDKVLDMVIGRSVTLGSGVKDAEDITGVIVGVCGPVGLGDDVARAVGKIDKRRRRAVGGIELHQEVFGW